MAAEADTANALLSDPSQPAMANSSVTRDTLDSVTALARFEFEPGRGNEGTKIVMVEWQDDNKTRHQTGSWQVSWPGKKTTFAADDNPSDSTNRLYFLLPPGATIPPSITVTYRPPREKKAENERPSSEDGKDDDGALHMTVHPLPAIFTPELGATAKASGKKGVLHTIWAKKRLQVLAKEIKAESELNLEGIGLEMAVAEKQWIEQNFGIATTSKPKPQPAQGLKLDLGNVNSGMASSPQSPGLQSPRSPGGRRLTDKLKGLSLMTSDKDFSSVNTPTRETNPLSPEVGDMAVSSFSAFKGDRPPRFNNPGPRRMVPISPPSAVSDEQAQSASASLAGIVRGEFVAMTNNNSNNNSINTGAPPSKPSENDGEDLFAVAMSPRSPDEPKSPFSIPSTEDGGGAFSRIKGIQPQKTF